MCNICALTQTFDPSRHAPDAPIFADIDESSDAAESTATIYTMAVGDTFFGTIGDGSDEDWISIELTAGVTYEIAHNGLSLGDPLVTLYDASGQQIASNDDGGPGLNSLLEFTATETGTYYIAADAYGINTGTYALSVSEGAPPPPPAGSEGTLDELANFLLEGTSGISRSYDTSQSNQITVDISGLTAEGQQLARWAMDAWEMVADLEFVVQLDGQGNEMITVDDEDSGAFAYYPNAGSTAAGVELNVSTQWLNSSGTRLDTYSFQTYVHEFGHALGLRHQGDYNYNGTPITYQDGAYFSNDSWQLSVMSYFSQTQNTTTDASFAYLSGAMMADIVAIQQLYGAPDEDSATAGNTVYGANSNLNNYMDDIFDRWATGNTSSAIGNSTMAMTIYDRDGVDLLDFGYMTSAARLDLRDEQFSDLGNKRDILGIARGTVIENANLGSGNDTVTGNAVGNNLSLGAGNDTVTAGGGNDTVVGGDGRDMVYLNQGRDRFIDNDQGGTSGRDTVFAGLGDDTIEGGGGNDEFHGEDGADIINAGSGNDLVYGGVGDDTISAGDGADTVYGQDGRDRVFLNAGDDLFVDNGQGGDAGSDTVFAGFGDDTIEGGGGNDEFHGEDGADVIYGRLGDDLLHGGLGDDTLNAGEGQDTVVGGDGRDLVFLNDGNDLFVDNGQGGAAGSDTVFGGAGNDVIDGGNGNDEFHGDDGFDVIFARLGNDSVYGGIGGDTIDAGDGNDLVYGGGGQDQIFLGAGNDRYVDTAQAGEWGRDSIYGGSGADTFSFGAIISEDTIFDFEVGVDTLELASALVGGRTAQQVEDQMFQFGDNGVYFFAGAGQAIYLNSVTGLEGLAESITII
ncbi:MAG: M10 family metallopeptidase C-terminal domain-containing protein [Pseudomonadota bacterium]